MVLGHESAGTVTRLGPKVTTLRVGDRIAMEPGVPCRRCARCKEGRYNLCSKMAFAATPPTHGTLAKYYTLPEDFCYKLPDHVSLEEGALLEPMSVAVHMCRQASIRPGNSVIVFGAGPVGLLGCVVAKAFGAIKVVAVDVNDDRLHFALQHVATAAFKNTDENAERNAQRLVHELDLGDGADVVLDASGAEACMQMGVHALRAGGTYVQVSCLALEPFLDYSPMVQGGMGKADVSWPIATMCAKELHVHGSFRYASGDYKTAVDLVATGKVQIHQLVTSKVSFSDAEKAFCDAKAGKGIKILIGAPQGR